MEEFLTVDVFCKTHDCTVIQVDPATPMFEWDAEKQITVFRDDNSYCTFKGEYDGREHEYLIVCH